jgi:hypothetical protein
MAQNIEVDININNNTEATIKNLRALKKQLRETAAGSAEFDKISMQIRDMDDAIKDASATSDDFLGYLEGASGPLGVLGTGIRSAEKNFSSFNAILKASIIGIIVLAIGGLVAAFNKSETAMKKLEPVFMAFEKILAGIMKVFDPLLDLFIDLALRVLPYITKGIGGFYSGLFALFTLLKNVGVGAGKILKGIFTLDFDALKEGYEQLAGSWQSAVTEFQAANKRFEEGSNSVTKKEEKNSKARVSSHKTEVKEKAKANDEYLDKYSQALIDEIFAYEEKEKKIAELRDKYIAENENILAETEQQKLDLWYRRQKEEINRITEAGGERNELYALLETQRFDKQKEINAKAAENEQRFLDARLSAQLQFVDAIQGVIQALGALFDQGSAEAKTFALLDIAVGTAKGFIQGLNIAQQSAAAAGPGAAFAFPIFFAQQIGSVLAAASRAKAILQSGNSSASGGGLAAAPAPASPVFNVVGTSGVNQIAQTIGRDQAPVKAYVVANDVTTAQSLNRNIVSSATLG